MGYQFDYGTDNSRSSSSHFDACVDTLRGKCPLIAGTKNYLEMSLDVGRNSGPVGKGEAKLKLFGYTDKGEERDMLYCAKFPVKFVK